MSTFSGAFSKDGKYWCELNVWVASRNNNQTVIGWEFYICAPSSGSKWNNYHRCSWAVTIHGAQVASGSNADYDFRSSKRICVSAGQTTVTHTGGLNASCQAWWSGDSTALGSAQASGSLWLAEHIQPPIMPTDITVQRLDDYSVRLTWRNHELPTQPYGNSEIWRKGNIDTVWRRIASPVGTSYIDRTTIPDRQYWYGVHNRNSVGESGAGVPDSIPVWTTPKTPPQPDVVVDGTDVYLEWDENGRCPLVGWEIEKTRGDEKETLTVARQGASMRVKVDSTEQNWAGYTHSYRVRALAGASLSDIRIRSVWSQPSTPLTVFSTANPPQLVSPANGTIVPIGSTVVFQWVHNPTDSSAQSQAHLLVRYGNNQLIKQATVTGNIQQATWMADKTGTFNWVVQTAGANNQLSRPSTAWALTVANPPSVTITSPATGGQTFNSAPTIEWESSTSAPGGQQSALVTVTDETGLVVARETLGAETSWRPEGVTFYSDITYTVSVTVTDSNGLTTESRTTFTTVFEPPEPPEVSYVFDSATGTVQAMLSGGSDEGTVVLWADYGDGWVQVGQPVDYAGESLTLSDPTGTPATMYRVRATAPTLAFADTPERTPTPDRGESAGVWFYLNAGDNLEKIVRWRGRPTSQHQFEQSKTLYQFSGRPWPVEYTGLAKNRTTSIGGILEANQTFSNPSALREVVEANTATLYRDPAGRRLWVSLAAFSLDDQPWESAGGLFWSFTATITQVEAPR